MSTTQYTAMDIANWFLEYNSFLRDFIGEDTDNISNLKLQKLLYYAEGSFLALRDQSLFPEPIVAWKHGPVVESVYHAFKENGSSGIESFEEVSIDPDTEAVLKQVYDVFGKYSAWGLRELTHQEDPWKNAEQSGNISRDDIKKYFKEHYVA
ncbi:MAG: DUF4065 domain-containing protein [Clostridiales bacterium]|nr:DUF4065 domain-containing protein [Clostridiales bacterium]